MSSQPIQPTQLLTVREAAVVLRCSATNVYSLIDNGELPFVRVGNAKGYRIDPRDIDEFIQQRKQAKAGSRVNGTPARPKLKHIKL
jgi:excisionase family DNA binding protein